MFLILLMMLLTVLIEIAILKWVKGENIPWHEIIFNLNSGQLILWILRGLEVTLFTFVLRHANFHIVDSIPTPFVWVIAFICWDLGFYWMHRMHHKIPFLWSVHSIHHQGEHFSLSLGVRNSWYSSLTNFPFIMWLAMLGVPIEIFVVVSSIHYSIQFYNHTALVKSSGILDKLMITPLNHRVHHAEHPIYRDKNFGGTFLWWDKIFGTFQAPVENIPMRFGSKMRVRTFNPLWANSGKTLARLIQKGFAKVPTLRSVFPISYVSIAGITLFMMMVNYVRLEEILVFNDKVVYIIWLWCATVSLGASSDGTQVAGLSWCILCLFAPLIFSLSGILLSTINLLLLFSIFCLGVTAFPLVLKYYQPERAN